VIVKTARAGTQVDLRTLARMPEIRSKTGQIVATVILCLNYIRSILLKTCRKPGFRPGFRQVSEHVSDKSATKISRKQVTDLIDLS